MSELVFISFFNYGGIDLAKNHIESLKRNGINNYIAFVTDQESYNHLLNIGYKVSLYNESDNISSEKHNFASTQFNNMSYGRYFVINQLLKQGKTVWYLDIDTVVLGDLNQYYNSVKSINFDICFQDDVNMLCTGCMLFHPNPNTIQLTEFMFQQQNEKDNDQTFMNRILGNGQFKVGVFAQKQFPNGLLFFNELSENPIYREKQLEFRNSNEPILFVHANWMVGIDTKIKALKDNNLWFI